MQALKGCNVCQNYMTEKCCELYLRFVDITLKEFQNQEQETLYKLLLENDWPFHSGSKITRATFDKRIESDFYNKPSVKTFLIKNEDRCVGMIRFFDLGESEQDDETPLFDLRIAEAHRGKGFGRLALKQAVNFAFDNYPNKTRIEATTRSDNKAMRKILLNCGFVKEAHYRESWKTDNGTLLDTVGYGLLRKDWEKGEATPVEWES